VEVVQLLLDNKASLSKTDSKGRNALVCCHPLSSPGTLHILSSPGLGCDALPARCSLNHHWA
jgi:hypothetical protein